MPPEFAHGLLTAPDFFDPALDALIAAAAIREDYPAGHLFLAPGETMDFFYYIHSGRTRHAMEGPDGSSKVLYTLTAGWFFGETPYFMKRPTGLSSQTEVATVLYRLSDTLICRLLAEHPLFRETVIQCLCHKLLITRFEIGNLAFSSIQSRILKLFCSAARTDQLHDGAWYPTTCQYTQAQIGEIVGASRVTVSRQISELCESGALRVLNNRVEVHREAYEKFTRHSIG